MEKLLTPKQLSEALQLSLRTIYDYTHSGYIPHYKLKKGVRFRGSEIERWIRGKKVRGRKSLKIAVSEVL